jgi:hypothetical protein
MGYYYSQPLPLHTNERDKGRHILPKKKSLAWLKDQIRAVGEIGEYELGFPGVFSKAAPELKG